MLIKMLNSLSRDLNEITAGDYGEEQITNSEQCSELDTTATVMVSDHVDTIMDISSMMDKTLPKNSIYYYFPSTFEVAK